MDVASLEAWQWVLGLTGAFFIGLGKGGLPGLGNLTIVFYVYAFGGKPSVGVLLPVLMCADLVAVTVYRREPSWPHVWKLLPWMVVGIVVGYFFFAVLDEEQVRQVIGGILLFMTALHFLRRWIRYRYPGKADAVPHSLGFRMGTGILGGFATMVANAAGPVAQLYLLSVGLPKMVFIGTGAWCFLFVNWIKVPFFIDLDLINGGSLPLSLAMAPAAMVGVLVARKVITYVPQWLFDWLIWVFIVLAAINMVMT